MGAPVSDMQTGEQPAAESLLKAFKTIDASERRRHATVLNYWLSIRGDKELPPLHDLDPLEISDAAPNSLLLELIGGGEDAEIRHIGEKLKEQGEAERIIDAPRPSILASIASKLSIVAISRNALSFEDEFPTADGAMRCWVTLLPLSSAGSWADYVYGFVSFDAAPVEVPEAVEAPVVEVESAAVEPADVVEAPEVVEDALAPVVIDEPEAPVAEIEEPPVEAVEAVEASEDLASVEEDPVPAPKAAPGFSKLIDSLAGLTGFYGSNAKVEPTLPPAAEVEPEAVAEPVDETAEERVAFEPPVEDVVEEPVIELVDELPAAPPVEDTAEEPVIELVDEAPAESAIKEIVDEAAAQEPAIESSSAMEGTLQSKLEDVRGKADEARLAKLASNAALYDGLSAAYDFALDAEGAPAEYLKLVEAKGLKIQLRSPMTPVVKLAFDGLCDEATIGQLEAVLAWALEQDLPRGSLAERIQSEGGIAAILAGLAKAA
jgi:hypothetical protein